MVSDANGGCRNGSGGPLRCRFLSAPNPGKTRRRNRVPNSPRNQIWELTSPDKATQSHSCPYYTISINSYPYLKARGA
ncbi:hypothetical protein AMTR_s00003p00270330 [Amborella trichopoda]|uniref:Uncharacterized protein n=1 Tax=Amborella trichopoda TaxID=13333 RepID=W1P747_AMBTC|nr:hypothetical protein AMTR_s00003p00270330 [Amborella trichopoda]